MFLKNPDEIETTIQKIHFTIFAFPKNSTFPAIQKAINISPNEKNSITIENIHNIEDIVRTKQPTALIITINHADRMTHSAQNCFSKLLEEPGHHIHFVFLSHQPNKLLPTVRSRAHIFHLKSDTKINSPPSHDPKIINQAKQYISARPHQLAILSKNLAKDRDQALEILNAAIELLYKSYFKAPNPKFLKKLEKLEKTHDNINKNGHIRLQLVAGMV
jgi:DNA polymerase III delta prime subunit